MNGIFRITCFEIGSGHKKISGSVKAPGDSGSVAVYALLGT